MKATRKNLVENWVIKQKLLNLLEFWDEIWYFTKIWSQRVQNMQHEFNREEFLKAYDDYIHDSWALKMWDYKEIQEDILLLKIWDINVNKWRYWCYVFYKMKNEFH